MTIQRAGRRTELLGRLRRYPVVGLLRQLDAGQFAHDAAVAELLGEKLSPAWLACLGALRRLWPPPAASPAELESFGPGRFVAPSSDEAAAREFWLCLRVTRMPEPPELVLHEARRRMRILNSELHALHMRTARPAD